MKPSPGARLLLSIVAVAVLVAGAKYHDLRIFFASWAAFLVLIYIAGRGRPPWRIKLKDYLLYVLVSLTLVMGIVLYAWHQAHLSRR